MGRERREGAKEGHGERGRGGGRRGYRVQEGMEKGED